MPALKDFAAFIFDLDGLVLDTEPTYFAAWRSAVKAMGYQVEPERFLGLSGFHYHEVEKMMRSWFGNDFDVQAFKQLGTACWLEYVHKEGISIKPGVLDLLAYANRQNIPVGLATNSSKVYAQECLAIAGLTGQFPLLIAGDDVEQAKPNPEIFLKSASLIGVDINQCVIFEDSHTGIVAAAKSGAYTVYVPSTESVNPATVELCDCLLTDLTQAFETFARQAAFGI